MIMTHKAEVLAFDREKRVYKDAYVDNFRRVRHFPALAAIGAGRSDGDSIILVQETAGGDASATPRSAPRSKLDDVQSRLMPTDPVLDMFTSTPPLTSFRTAVMCKHTNARRENAASLASSSPSTESSQLSSSDASRYNLTQASIFMPSSATEAKSAIARKASYNHEDYTDRPQVGREFASPHGKPEWAYNNPIVAKEDVRTRTYFHLPPEGAIRADRRYTQEFVQQHVEAYQASRQQLTRSRKIT